MVLVVLAPVWSPTRLMARWPVRQAVAALVSVVVLSFGGSSAWGLPIDTVISGWDGPGLGSVDLTYYFGTPTSDLTIETQHKAMAGALRVWSSEVAVRFSETRFAHQFRSIDFNFCPFSTCAPTSRSLAFSNYPTFPSPISGEPLDGDIFFNDDYLWEIGDGREDAFDVTYVAVHELGHSLGLSHSDNPLSVMFPVTGTNKVFTGLHQDEIEAMQTLYARNSAPPAPVPEPSTVLLLTTTAAGLGLARWRQRKRKQQP